MNWFKIVTGGVARFVSVIREIVTPSSKEKASKMRGRNVRP
jgi:hypothetical protein